MMTFREYGKRVGISYEAVRQLTVTHAEELQGHIHKQGRTRVLDDEAVTLLDAVRSNNPVVVLQVSRDEEFIGQNFEIMLQEYTNLLQEIHKVLIKKGKQIAKKMGIM